jgi:DNA-binding IclR family transcriptional regulator
MGIHPVQVPLVADSASSRSEGRMAAIDKAMVLFGVMHRAGRPMGLSELSRRAGVAKSTTHRLLKAMLKSGMVSRSGAVYSVEDCGVVSAPIPDASTTRLKQDLRKFVPFICDLVAATRFTASLAVLRGTEVVFAHRTYGHSHVQTPSDDSGVACAYRTAAGRLLLSNDFRAACDVAYGQDIDVARFYDELAQIRRDRFAGAEHAGVTCVAVPFLTGAGLPATVLTVKGATSLVDRAQILAHLHRVVHVASGFRLKAM